MPVVAVAVVVDDDVAVVDPVILDFVSRLENLFWALYRECPH